jgi:hypothetical protein
VSPTDRKIVPSPLLALIEMGTISPEAMFSEISA